MKEKVLVIDDNHDILELLRHILEEEGYQVECWNRPSNMIERVKELGPDLILLDVMLGDFDGRILCHQLKTCFETCNIPVILISASHRPVDWFVDHVHPDAFIEKPFDLFHFQQSIGQQLGKNSNVTP